MVEVHIVAAGDFPCLNTVVLFGDIDGRIGGNEDASVNNAVITEADTDGAGRDIDVAALANRERLTLTGIVMSGNDGGRQSHLRVRANDDTGG